MAFRLNQKKLTIILFFIVVLLAALVLYFYTVSAKAHQSDPTAVNTDDVVRAVAALVVLPDTAETPRLAIVTDLTPLKKQPFFARAETGDQVLIYMKAGWAILYSPKVKRVVNMSPIQFKTNEAGEPLLTF